MSRIKFASEEEKRLRKKLMDANWYQRTKKKHNILCKIYNRRTRRSISKPLYYGKCPKCNIEGLFRVRCIKNLSTGSISNGDIICSHPHPDKYIKEFAGCYIGSLNKVEKTGIYSQLIGEAKNAVKEIKYEQNTKLVME